MVITYLHQRHNSPSFGRQESFSDFSSSSDLRIVEDDDNDDSDDEVDEGIVDAATEDATPKGWSTLPHILLEDILAFVPQKDRYSAALVCRRWADTFSAPRVWRKVEVHANSFMCKKMRFRRTSHGHGQYQKTYITEQKVDSPKLFQDCINLIGRFVKCIEFYPISDCRKVVEFLSALEAFKEDLPVDEGIEDPRSSPRRRDVDEDVEDPRSSPRRRDVDDIDEKRLQKRQQQRLRMPLAQLEEFIFHYAFDTMETSFEGVQVLGTGGTILAQLKTSIGSFKHLKRLELQNLFLDADEGLEILNSFVDCKHLNQIDAFNLTKEETTTIDPRLFPNLESLLVSPLQLTEELISTVSEAVSLDRLDVAFDEFSDCNIKVIDKQIWNNLKEAKPHLQIRLECRGKFNGEFLLLANAPVTHVIYQSPAAELTLDSIAPIVECYKTSLSCFAQIHLPCSYLTKKTADRVHVALLELAKNCPKLKTIAVRDMIFSSTILYLLTRNPNIQNFHVRRNALLLRNIFSSNHDRHISLEEHRFLRLHSSSIRNLRQGVDQLLQSSSIRNRRHGFDEAVGWRQLAGGWRPLTENSFKRCL